MLIRTQSAPEIINKLAAVAHNRPSLPPLCLSLLEDFLKSRRVDVLILCHPDNAAFMVDYLAVGRNLNISARNNVTVPEFC